jgi:heme oxygenase (mycobilin-producing)
MGEPVRVMLYVADPEHAPGSVESAYQAVSHALDGTPGLLGNSLLRSVEDPRSFVVVSEWADLRAFREWEGGNGHRDTTSPLRPLQTPAASRVFGVYEIAMSYRSGMG